MGQRAGREIVEMAERYPILLSITGLMLGAVAGAALRPTVAEDRYVGPASDARRRRAKQTVSDQLEQVAATADEVISSVEDRLPREEDRQEQAGSPDRRRDPVGPGEECRSQLPEVDSNAVVAGAADADEATASRKEKRGESRAPSLGTMHSLKSEHDPVQDRSAMRRGRTLAEGPRRPAGARLR